MKFAEQDIASKLTYIFCQAGPGAANTTITNARKLADGEKISAARHYPKWTKADLEAFIQCAQQLQQDGFALGQRYKTNDIKAQIQTTLSSITRNKPEQTSNQKPQFRRNPSPKKVSLTARNQFAKQLQDELSRAEQRYITAPSGDLGTGAIFLKENPLAINLTPILAPLVITRVQRFLESAPPSDPKPAYFWERYLPKRLQEQETQGVELVLNSTRLGQVPQAELSQILKEETLAGIYDDLTRSQRRLDYEAKLLEGWKEARPNWWALANSHTQDFLNFHYKNTNSPQARAAREAVRIARMAGFRLLDAHFTGEQEIKGVSKFKRANFAFLENLSASERKEFNQRYGFIQIGVVDRVTYGTNSEGEVYLQRAFTENSFKASKEADIKYSPDNFVQDMAAEIAPILTMSDLRAAQKGLNGQAFLFELYHLSLQPSETIPTPKVEQTNLSADELTFLGIPMTETESRQQAKRLTADTLPDFQAAIEQHEPLFIPNLIKSLVLNPVMAQNTQRECIALYKKIHPEGYMHAINAQEGNLEVTARNAVATQAIEIIGLHQDLALGEMKKTQQIEPVKHKFQIIKPSAEGINWKGHSLNTNPNQPQGWILLEDHLRDMTKDGLSQRTIQMGGMYSVVDPEVAVEIVSRYGRSEPHAGMTKNGRLLVYPNPLIYFEQHSKTDRTDKKYVAPDGSCNPPLVVPVQADFTKYNQNYLGNLNGDQKQAEMGEALKRLKDVERQVDIDNYTKCFVANGFSEERAARLGRALFEQSTVSKLYTAMDDPSATIEITEGQKKTYAMYQSYKELIEAEDLKFASGFNPTHKDEDILEIISKKPNRENKLFVCSPGVWLPVKGWSNFNPEEKAAFCEALQVKDLNGSKSPLNAQCKHALIPSWVSMIDMTGRNIVITYDSDAQYNIGVTQSVSAMAQAIHDVFPNSRLNYRLIEGENPNSKLGADDYLVQYGSKPFWDTLQVEEVAANVPWKELNERGKTSQSLIRYLVDKRRKDRDAHAPFELAVS